MKATFCSDNHNAPPGHPAADNTWGFKESWAEVPGLTGPEYFALSLVERECVEAINLCLGDMNEYVQFTRKEIPDPVHTDVDGNHDRGTAPRELTLTTEKGRTIVLHGDIFDPWVVRKLGWIGGKIGRLLECFWSDSDVWFKQKLGTGRHGSMEKYAQKAAEYAAARGAWQIVFGHLHQLFDEDVSTSLGRTVHVVCTGCCVNGRLDFVEIEV